MVGSENKLWFANNKQDGFWTSSSITRRGLLAGAGGIALLGTLAACTGESQSPSGAGQSGGTPKRGGNFRLGVTGGGAKGFDAHYLPTKADNARVGAAFETLLTFDDDYQLQTDGLAESVEADNPLQYTIRLRKGITFQDGKPLTVDDVIYTFRRVGNKETGAVSFGATSRIDLANLKKMDDLTLRVPLLSPDSALPEALAAFSFGIVPVGYEKFKGDASTQIGTGAYRLKSLSPGQQSVHERNPNYWRGDGSPYFDSVTIVEFADTTAQVNALLGGQIDALTDLPAAQVETVKASGKNVLNSPTGGFPTLCMAIDMPPFDDVRVRKAFRLIADRQQMIDRVASGYGSVANDLYSPFDPGYAKDLPQRKKDIDQAKSLLKQAGKEGLKVDLHASNVTGMVEIATVFAAQAKEAGVEVNVISVPNYYGDDYGKLAFSVEVWGTRNYLNMVLQGSLPSSPYNLTHWPPKTGEGSNFEDLYKQALAATDAAKRNEIMHEMQKLEYDLGGNIIPYFSNQIDGYAANVAGLAPSKNTLNLAGYGHGYRTIWFSN